MNFVSASAFNKRFGLMLVGALMLCASTCCYALTKPTSVQLLKINDIDKFFAHNVKRENPLSHTLDSGLIIRGFKLSNSLFLTQYPQQDGHNLLGISIKDGEYVYQLGINRLAVSLLF